MAAAQSPAIVAAMLAAAAGRPLRLRPEAVAAAYRDQLMTVTQCAELFGVSRTTIVKLLTAQGIALRKPGDGVDDEDVVTAYRDHRLSLHETAGRFGISQRRVAAVLDQHGVARRPAGRPAQRRG
jgi:excisionase family DNA binding protein